MYSCAFVPSSPADLPQSVGERSDAALGDATVVPDDAGWRDTIGEAASAYAEGSSTGWTPAHWSSRKPSFLPHVTPRQREPSAHLASPG